MARANVNIFTGQLKSPPRSYEAAVARLKQIDHELKKIQAQFDKNTPANFPSLAKYTAWFDSAKKAQLAFEMEKKGTEEWVAANTPSLFRQAYELLRDLEIEVDFEPEETALMEKLEEHFKKEQS